LACLSYPVIGLLLIFKIMNVIIQGRAGLSTPEHQGFSMTNVICDLQVNWL
jgi:hypothetical protein